MIFDFYNTVLWIMYLTAIFPSYTAAGVREKSVLITDIILVYGHLVALVYNLIYDSVYCLPSKSFCP